MRLHLPQEVLFEGGGDIRNGYFDAVARSTEKCYNHNREGKLICELCVLSCPDQAISWHPETEEEKKR